MGASLKYLAPYVFRVAISDRRIVACEQGEVTFSYRRSGSNRWRKMTVDASEFIRRFLQHVLPSGFQKVAPRDLEPQQPGIARNGAVAGEVAQRHAPGVGPCRRCGGPHRAAGPLSQLRWPDAPHWLSAGFPLHLLRYELVMATVLTNSCRCDMTSRSRSPRPLRAWGVEPRPCWQALPATNSVSNRLPLAQLQPTTTVARRFPSALSPPPPLWAELYNEPLP